MGAALEKAKIQKKEKKRKKKNKKQKRSSCCDTVAQVADSGLKYTELLQLQCKLASIPSQGNFHMPREKKKKKKKKEYQKNLDFITSDPSPTYISSFIQRH